MLVPEELVASGAVIRQTWTSRTKLQIRKQPFDWQLNWTSGRPNEGSAEFWLFCCLWQIGLVLCPLALFAHRVWFLFSLALPFLCITTGLCVFVAAFVTVRVCWFAGLLLLHFRFGRWRMYARLTCTVYPLD